MFEALASIFDICTGSAPILDVGVRVDDASETWEREG
jgi:hypothetical protein